jgi:uncharacterized protein
MGTRRCSMAAAAVAALVLSIACSNGGPGSPSRNSSTSTTTSTSAPPVTPAKRVMVVTHTTGFRHSSIEIAESTVKRLGDESRLYTTVFCRNGEDVGRMLTPAGLADVDAVFFANTTGNLGIPDLAAFLQWIRAGHAFLGAHSASDTYHDEPAYLDMLGAEFDQHGDQTSVDIRIEDRTHPATAPLPSPFRIFDEIYEFRSSPRSRAAILLSLDRHPSDGHPQAGTPGDFPLAWSRQYGEGRVFYTALGHREDVWTNALFQQHILGAIRWAMGM